MSHDDPWILQRTGPVEPADWAYLANGHLGLRVPPWGNGFGAVSRSYLAGLHYGRASSERVSDSTSTNPPLACLTNWSAISLAYEGRGGEPRPFFPPSDPGQVREVHDLGRAVFASTLEHDQAWIAQQLLIHQVDRHLAMQELTLHPRGELTLVLDLGLDPAAGRGFQHERSQWQGGAAGFTALVQPTEDGHRTLQYEQVVEIRVGADRFSPGHTGPVRAVVRPDRPLRLRRLTWITADPTEKPDVAARLRALGQFETLWEQHVRAWQVRWRSRAEVPEPAWQRKINVASYNLKASHREDNPCSVAATGLASDAWNGFVFPWDACLWILPYYLLTAPPLARAMLDFERTGTMLKWPRPAYYASGEGIKIYEGGCVALAAWRYFLVTGERAWLAEAGWPLIEAAALGYARRAVHNPALDRWELRGVWPTDEFAAKDSDNDVFTNAMAQRTIAILVRVCGLLDRPVPDAVRPLLEREFWLPFDESQQRHLEYASFSDGRITRAHDGHLIKQADTSLIAHPLNLPLDPAVVRNNLLYYSDRVARDGTPEMTWGIYATIAARLGEPDLVMRFLDEIGTFLRTPMHIFHETRDNDTTVFLTGSGDLMQAIYFGCGGVDIEEGPPRFRPCVPEKMGGRLILRGLHLGGRSGDVEIHAARVVESDFLPAERDISASSTSHTRG